MPRQARPTTSTGIFHVMMRGINHQNIFEDEEDYYRFLNTLNNMAEAFEPDELRKQTFQALKGRRASLRQLSRLTGIGKGVIHRIWQTGQEN